MDYITIQHENLWMDGVDWRLEKTVQVFWIWHIFPWPFKISMKFVLAGPIDNKSSLTPVMAWLSYLAQLWHDQAIVNWKQIFHLTTFPLNVILGDLSRW